MKLKIAVSVFKLPKGEAFSAKYWIDRCKAAKIDVFCPNSLSSGGGDWGFGLHMRFLG